MVPFPLRGLEARGLSRPEAIIGWIPQGEFLPLSPRDRGEQVGHELPFPPMTLTVLNDAVGEEVLDGVSVDQSHAPALSRHAVLRLLLFGPRQGWLQLYLWRGWSGGFQDKFPEIA